MHLEFPEVVMKTFNRKSITLKALVLAMSVVAPVSLKADTILGIYISASSWQPDFSGEIDNSGPVINLNDQLNITDDSSTLTSFALEHPVPWIPNVKVQRTELDTTSLSIIGSDINFGGVIFPSGSELNSQIDLSHTDYILYYEILDNWVSIDFGISLMNFDGNISLQSDGLASEVNLDDYVPAGYARASFELPLTGVFAGVEGSLLSVGDNSISDYKVFLGWESEFGLGAEVGYHSFSVDWEDFDSSNGDLTFDGYYVSVNYHF